MSNVWTAQDLDIVESLTRRVRLLGTEQIKRIWFAQDANCLTLRRRLRRLVRAGFLQRSIINAHPLLAVKKPLQAWRPGKNDPNFERISGRARTRWSEPSVPVEVYYAAPLAANLFGSSAGHLPDLNHRDHDLLLGQVFTYYRTHRCHEANRWLGEDALPKAGYRIKDPDAFLIDDEGKPYRIVESAGRYSPVQVESFHEHCVENELPYELW